MKKLEKIIKEAILEVIEEGNKLYALKNPADSAKGLASTIDPDDATEKSPAFISKYKPVSEGELDEMARVPVQYKIADLSKLDDLSDKVKGSKGVQGIISYLQNKGQAPVALIAKEQFNRPQQAINPIILSLTAAGVLDTVAGSGVAPSRVNKATGEIAPKEEEPETFEPDDYFIGSRFATREPKPDPTPEEVAASFAKALSIDGGSDEDFVRNLPKDAPVSAKKVSEEDYQKLMKYLNLKDRLNKIKSDIRQNKKLGKGGDDLGGGSTSKENEELMKKVEDTTNRINDLISSSEYLKSRKTPEGEIKENKQRRLKKIN
jgi:hypothetical protein